MALASRRQLAELGDKVATRVRRFISLFNRSRPLVVGIKQHFVALTGVGHQPEGPAGAQFHVRDLHAPINAAHDQAFFAPVELKGFAQIELQGHEGFDVFTLWWSSYFGHINRMLNCRFMLESIG